jgi:hypothetical protein
MQAQPISKIPAKGAALEPWQQSLSDARRIVKAVLGAAASTIVAERQSGIYRGVIIGQTKDYIIQQIGKQPNAVIHFKDLFRTASREFSLPEVGRAFSIHYARSRAIAREIRERLRAEERSR